MSPLVPIGELHGLPLRQGRADDRRLFSRETPTSIRSHHQHPCYGVEDKTVVGADAEAW
jgi:hypothetical protein